MKKIILSLSIILLTFSSNAQQTATLLYHWQDTAMVGSWTYDNAYNECWGVVVNDREIAIIGSTEGTHFFDITNPASATEVAFVAGAYTGGGVIHRDYHDFDDYLYVVCDEGSSSTLQIIDISNLPNSVNTVYDSNALFTKAHNIFIDTATAKLYVCTVTHTIPNNSFSAMEIYSLANPGSPTLLYTYNDVTVGHVHDAYVRNDTAYLNCGGDGLRIVDFHYLDLPGGMAPTELASLSSSGYNHSGWLNDEGTVYAMLHENHGYDIKLLDVSNFNNITVLSTFNSEVDSNSMAHNAIIEEGLLFVSYYHDGLRVFDISEPANPVQTWKYDTYAPNSHASYKGAWGVYPNLPSGNIIVSDMQTGLYLFECGTPTSIIEKKLNTKVFPNPATNQFTLLNTHAESLTLYNTLGVKVKEQQLNENQNTIYKGNLANGLYFYHLNSRNILIESGKVIFE